MTKTKCSYAATLLAGVVAFNVVTDALLLYPIHQLRLQPMTLMLSSHSRRLRHPGKHGARTLQAHSSVFEEWQNFQQAQTNLELLAALVKPQTSLFEVSLVGQSQLPATNNDRVPCLVFARTDSYLSHAAESESATSCLIIPVTDPQLKLIAFAVQDKPLSKSIMLPLNQLLVNRDGTLFDNIPWSDWTVDPQLRNRDAANNNIAPQYHLGKRDAYARFGGKDWKGRSVSIANLAMRLKYTLEKKRQQPTNGDDALLTKRIIELQLTELREEMAEIEYELAIARQNVQDQVQGWEDKRTECLMRLQTAEKSQHEILNAQSSSTSALSHILDSIANTMSQQGMNSAPYRGAMGYAPILDTELDIETGMLPFSSPFGLMKEILQDQCKAQVIGALLENTSLLDGTLTVGGVIVIQRMTAKTTMTIAGEEVSINDESVDYGNTGIRGGETILVECSADEAVGMALVSKVPMLVESEIWDQASGLATQLPRQKDKENVMDNLMQWVPDQDLSFLLEGQPTNMSVSQNASPLRIPRTTTSLFDTLFEPNPAGSASSGSSLFPTDNPIQSLQEYDSLSVSDKAKTLMTMSNFDGRLPRPRALRANAANDSNSPGPLDTLLLPLIDESVRRQYLIRDAERRNDYGAIRDLEAQKSRRQIAKEMAEEAKRVGDDDSAKIFESEAEFYASLRADVTQDEGTYTRFLDQDDWYARDRQAHVKKLDKKKFGTLLDGIE
jgi:hypothetical protein